MFTSFSMFGSVDPVIVPSSMEALVGETVQFWCYSVGEVCWSFYKNKWILKNNSLGKEEWTYLSKKRHSSLDESVLPNNAIVNREKKMITLDFLHYGNEGTYQCTSKCNLNAPVGTATLKLVGEVYA